MSLSAKELKEKIDIVSKDLRDLQGTSGNVRKIEALSEYKRYLEDQLKQAPAEAQE